MLPTGAESEAYSRSAASLHTIAEATDRLDQFHFIVVVELRPKPLDERLQRVVFYVAPIAPNALDNAGAAQNPAGPPHQKFQQSILSFRQSDRPIRTRNLPRSRVEHEVGDP